MAEDEDYYKILGVRRDASQDDITHAYRELAKKWHPDINHSPDATAMFEKITKAYEVLKDPQKRAAYDKFGTGAFDENGNAGFNNGNFNGFQNAGFDADDLGDIFSQFFGGAASSGRRQRRYSGAHKGDDVFMKMRISFMEAVNGREVPMPYEYETTCDQCGGKGAVNASDVETCPTCGGTGTVISSQRTLFGTFQTQTTCPTCHGKGTRIVYPCPNCKGRGYVRVKTTLNIKIPAGINEGQQLRVPGKGGRGLNGGPNGDLFIEMVVEKDKTFTREGNDVHVNVQIPLTTAVLGGDVNVPTVYGTSELRIPSGTQPNTIMTLRRQGIRGVDGRTGDEFVHLYIRIPTHLSDSQRELYSQLAGQPDPDKDRNNIFSGIFHKK